MNGPMFFLVFGCGWFCGATALWWWFSYNRLIRRRGTIYDEAFESLRRECAKKVAKRQ